MYEGYSITSKLNEVPIDVDKFVDNALKEIFKGNDSVNSNLYQATAVNMREAIGSSIGLEYNVKNQTWINQLQTNVNVFSAFKAHHETEAITALLTDKGEVVPWNKFRDAALKVSDKYNKVHLKTEYNTALRRGRMGERFIGFQDDADLYPNLRWLASSSAKPREAHIQYYGLVLPVNDPFWNNQFPGNDWNCKCDIEQTKDEAGKAPKDQPDPPPGLEGNPAFTNELIGSKHPYFDGLNKTETTAAMQLVKTDMEAQTNNWAKANIGAGGLVVKNSILQSGTLKMLKTNVKSMAKVPEPFLKTYPTLLADDVTNWEYVGYKSIDSKKNAGATKLIFYKTVYGEIELFINSKLTKAGIEQPIALMTDISKIALKK